jgi:hypothetical protein
MLTIHIEREGRTARISACSLRILSGHNTRLDVTKIQAKDLIESDPALILSGAGTTVVK